MMQAERRAMLPTVSPERIHAEKDSRKKISQEKTTFTAPTLSPAAETKDNPEKAVPSLRESFLYSSRLLSSRQQSTKRERRATSCLPRWSPPTRPSPEILSPPQARRVTSLSSHFRFRGQPSFPVQARRQHRSQSVPRNDFKVHLNFQYQVIGDPSLKVLRLRLPPHLLDLVDKIVLGCEAHAATLANGWFTELYSLTKQDIALAEAPHLYKLASPITNYIKRAMTTLYGAKTVKMDRNQPHVLKYAVDQGHTGVELHHDKCDVTANMCLSRSSSYVGGGTFFPALGHAVRLEFGEFLLHPGSLVHGGMNIQSGTRHLMVIFAHIK